VGYLGHRLIAGTDLITGTRKTHEQVARIIAGFLSSGEYDLPEDQQDRLSEFAEGE
jgi:hypothetical protein